MADETNYEMDETNAMNPTNPTNATPPSIEPEVTPDDFAAGLVMHHNQGRVELHDVDLGAADLADMRALAGVTLALPPQIEAGWLPNEEKHMHGWAIQQGLPRGTIQSLLDWYADAVTLFGGASEDDFRDWAAGRLTPTQTHWLVRFHRERVEGKGKS